MTTLSPAQIADAAYGAGFRGDSLTTAVAVALAESGGRVNAHNAQPPDNSYGLWQINMLGKLEGPRQKEFGISDNSDLFAAGKNASAARHVWKDAGGSFQPWSTYTNGAYRSHLSAASSAAAKAIATKGHAAGGSSSPSSLSSSSSSSKGDGKHGSSHQHGGHRGSTHHGGAHGSGQGSGDRIVVDTGELKTIGTKLDAHHDVLVKLATQAQHRTLDLDLAGLAAGSGGAWAVTDPSQAAKVKADLDAATTTGSRSATSAAKDLLDTAGWVSRVRAKMVAADGTDGRGAGAKPAGSTHKPSEKGDSPSPTRKPKPRHPSSPASTKSAEIDKVLDVGRANLASKTKITDGGTNHTRYGQWYGNNGAPWCAQFVSYTFHEAGHDLPAIDGPHGFQSVASATHYAASKGLLHSTPNVGDVFLYRDGHHTGIVSKVYGDGTIGTIEGNAGSNTDRVVTGHRTDVSAMRFWSPIR